MNPKRISNLRSIALLMHIFFSFFFVFIEIMTAFDISVVRLATMKKMASFSCLKLNLLFLPSLLSSEET